MTARADSGVEERLVGVDVADAVQERLIEERGLDGCLAVAEERNELVQRNGKRLAPGAGVRLVGTERRPKRRASTKRSSLPPLSVRMA